MKQELNEQLPLLVNGSLNADEQAQLQSAIQEDRELQQEVEFLTALREGIQSAVDEQHSPGELGLARLKKEIQAEKKSSTKVGTVISPMWRRVAIAACAIVALQSAFLVTENMGPPDTGITTLSGSGISGGPVVQVVFDSQATAAQIQSAVLAVDGSIIAGPSALGLFQIALPESAEPDQAIAVLEGLNFVEEVNLQ